MEEYENTKNPTVSIITATYNRSEILYYTLSSLQNSQFSSWECIVVGDACTDDTAELVSSLNDSRFLFTNLKINFGEQSAPNNHGCSLAKGKYIAFLNHDDLWFPNHLSTCISHLEKNGADLVFPIGAILSADNRAWVKCIADTGKYEPYVIVPASLWLFKRELLQEIGPWRSFKQTRNTPSQDWLWRAWRKKKQMILIPRLTALLMQSGSRKDCYIKRDDSENKNAFESILNDPGFAESILLKTLIQCKQEEKPTHFIYFFKKIIKTLFYKIFIGLKLPPGSFLNTIRYGFRGGIINYLRKKRGLDPK